MGPPGNAVSSRLDGPPRNRRRGNISVEGIKKKRKKNHLILISLFFLFSHTPVAN